MSHVETLLPHTMPQVFAKRSILGIAKTPHKSMMHWLLHILPGSVHNDSGFCEQLAYRSLFPVHSSVILVLLMLLLKIIRSMRMLVLQDRRCMFCNALPCPWHDLLLSRLEIPRPSFAKCSAHTKAAALPPNGTSPLSANTRKSNVILLVCCSAMSPCCLRSSKWNN